ncbi:MepB family protein [Staphylococcus simulans]
MNKQIDDSIRIIKMAIGQFDDMQIDKVIAENWNEEYGAHDCVINNQKFKARLAKKTPKKSGYFLALWKKNNSNKNIPFEEVDIENKLIINIQDGNKVGQFILPKEILAEKGIIQSKQHKGKMAFRIYPTWETGLNKTAQKSQKWQTQYFADLSKDIDKEALYRLYFES